MRGLLKFITCGSVDDGKSTLIGHILYDSKLLYTDQEQALLLDSKVGSRGGEIDYSLLLDGLMAEREQGITIDVAYRYFTTENRSFIVADTPGHEEYTRNMAVGASFADLAVILVDASQGVLVQTRRHARICALMGIRYFVFAINKMDLVDYDETRFHEIESQIRELKESLELPNVQLIPVSATAGDNITEKSSYTLWYDGPTLLTFLETVDVEESSHEAGFYMPVQRVCRPDSTFRGFQGQIESGLIRTGDAVTVLPSQETACVSRILVGDQEQELAVKGQPVTICLDREMDVSRGCVLTTDSDLQVAMGCRASILWMDDEPYYQGKSFFVKLGTRLIPGVITQVHYAIDVNTGDHIHKDTLSKNEIAECSLAFVSSIVLDEFKRHKTMGELILIDRVTNMTSACGVVTSIVSEKEDSFLINRDMRAKLKLQRAVVVELPADGLLLSVQEIREIERILAMHGRQTYLYQPNRNEPIAEIVRHLHHAGIVVLVANRYDLDLSEIAQVVPEGTYYNYTDLAERIVPEPEAIAEEILRVSENLFIDREKVKGYNVIDDCGV